MSFDFDALQKRLNGVSMEEVTKFAESKAASESSYEDEETGFWRPTYDKQGNAQAVLRLLPPLDGETPWVEYQDWFFKGPSGKYYVEKSLNTFNWEADPAAEWLSSQYDNHQGKGRPPLVAKYNVYRRYQHVVNVQVVNDVQNPDNNGGVFKYRFTAKGLMTMILDSMKETYPGETVINPFHPIEGANLVLNLYHKTDGDRSYPQYDKCRFENPSQMCGGDMEQIAAVLDQVQPIGYLVDRDNYRTYAELAVRFNAVMGIQPGATLTEAAAPSVGAEKASPLEETTSEVEYDSGEDSDDGDADDAMAMFRKAAADME